MEECDTIVTASWNEGNMHMLIRNTMIAADDEEKERSNRIVHTTNEIHVNQHYERSWYDFM